MELLFDVKGGDSVARLAMTMSIIAYQPNAPEISYQLATNPLTTNRWSLVWYGVDSSTDWDANQAYVARDVITGQLAIAIRGSITDPLSWAFWYDWLQEDLSAFSQVPWAYGGAPAGAAISQGSQNGFNDLLAIVGVDNQNNPMTLMQFMQINHTPNMLTAVMGHSLGGSLSLLLAPYLYQQLMPGQDMLGYWPITFAAPTVGNPVYADWIATRFFAGVCRYHNFVDVVPHAYAGLQWILDSFPGVGEPKIPELLYGIIWGIREYLHKYGIQYQQEHDGIPLYGKLVKSDDWLEEAGLQHAGATYLGLLELQSIPGTIPASAGSLDVVQKARTKAAGSQG